jgi:hypothetical protein
LALARPQGLVHPTLLLQSEDTMMLIKLLILSLSLQLRQPPFPFMLSTTAKSGKWELEQTLFDVPKVPITCTAVSKDFFKLSKLKAPGKSSGS